jgi:NAD(P)H:quinone oxidoreductase type IV
MKIAVVFYSMYGHTYKMAEAVAKGAREIEGAEVQLMQVPELCSEEVLREAGAIETRATFAHIPVAKPADLAAADAIIFGTPTRFGMMAAQMREFLDQTGHLWAKGAFINKVGSVFVSSGSLHGGHETTITSFHLNLLNYGMIVVGLRPDNAKLESTDKVHGGSPFGAGTISGHDGRRMPSDDELDLARIQGRRVAVITKILQGAPGA